MISILCMYIKCRCINSTAEIKTGSQRKMPAKKASLAFARCRIFLQSLFSYACFYFCELLCNGLLCIKNVQMFCMQAFPYAHFTCMRLLWVTGVLSVGIRILVALSSSGFLCRSGLCQSVPEWQAVPAGRIFVRLRRWCW